MVYEGEQQGAEVIAKKLIGTAVKKLFDAKFPPPDSGRPTERRRQEAEDEDEISGGPQRRARAGPARREDPPALRADRRLVRGGQPDHSLRRRAVHRASRVAAVGPEPKKAVEEHFSPASKEELAIGMELVLEGLTQHLKIAREDLDSRVSYTEMLKFNLVRNRAN